MGRQVHVKRNRRRPGGGGPGQPAQVFVRAGRGEQIVRRERSRLARPLLAALARFPATDERFQLAAGVSAQAGQ